MDDYPDNNPPPTGDGRIEHPAQDSYPQQGQGQGYSQQGQHSHQQQRGKPKSHIAAIVLTILLAGVGAGRFYLGHIGTAILKLSLYFVFFIGNFVSGFIEGFEASSGISASDSVESVARILSGLGWLCFVVWLVWWVVDLVRVITKKLEPKDGYYT